VGAIFFLHPLRHFGNGFAILDSVSFSSGHKFKKFVWLRYAC
jgi:hypothetical protein